jgi:hypothetical protein
MNEIDFAFREIRKVIWDEDCVEQVIPIVMDEYDLSETRAAEVVEAAYEKWYNAYDPD